MGDKRGEPADHIGQTHDPKIPIGDMADLVRQNACDFAAVEDPEQPVGAHNGGSADPSDRERVDQPAGEVMQLRRPRQLGPLRQFFDQAHRLRSRLRRQTLSSIHRQHQLFRTRCRDDQHRTDADDRPENAGTAPNQVAGASCDGAHPGDDQDGMDNVPQTVSESSSHRQTLALASRGRLYLSADEPSAASSARRRARALSRSST